jgi:DNA-binding MarR family transcriptional regulator
MLLRIAALYLAKYIALRYIEDIKMRELTDVDFRALAEFRHRLRRFIAFSEAAARQVGLEPRQHQVMLALRGLAPEREPSVQVLADQLALRHHTVVELLDRLERSGMVRRERDPVDRRRANVVLTQRGHEVLRQLSKSHLEELRTAAPELVGALNGVLRAARRAP